MESAATPPAKRVAPRAVAKAKRLILPPGPDVDDEPVVVDPVLRAKRAPRSSKPKPAIDPLLRVAPPPPADLAPPASPPAGAGVTAPVEPPVESRVESPVDERAAGVLTVEESPPLESPVIVDPVEPVVEPPASPAGPAGDGPLEDDTDQLRWTTPRARVAPPPVMPPVPVVVPPPPTVPQPVTVPPPSTQESPALVDDGGQVQLFEADDFAGERPMRKLRQPVALTRRRPRVRRVTRVIRHVDSWSVFKIALVFNIFVYIVGLTSSVLLWQVAQSTGTVDNVERFFEGFGWETFTLNGGELYHNLWVGGLFAVVGGTGLAVLLATMFNLITDLVGGMRVTVLEEEVISRVKLTTITPNDAPDAPANPG